jgi:hypothetical protein
MPKLLFGYTNILLRNSDLDISARSLSISGSVLKINSPNKTQAGYGPLHKWLVHNRGGTVGAAQWVLEVPAWPLPDPLRQETWTNAAPNDAGT